MGQAIQITPERSVGLLAGLSELWSARGILWIFIWRDLKVRYKHTFLGAAWNILQPVAMMVIYTVVFDVIFNARVGDVPYPLFAFPAILLWQLLARAIQTGGTNLDNFRGVLEKIYFPRLIIPASAVLGTLVDLLVASIPLLFLMMFYGVLPDRQILFAPLFILLATVLGFGLAVWLTALDAVYKDVRHTLNFATLFWMFATPIMYPVSMVPESVYPYYVLNPMVGIVQGFRWSLLPSASAPAPEMLISSVGIGLFLLVTGVRYFVKREGTFVDTF